MLLITILLSSATTVLAPTLPPSKTAYMNTEFQLFSGFLSFRFFFFFFTEHNSLLCMGCLETLCPWKNVVPWGVKKTSRVKNTPFFFWYIPVYLAFQLMYPQIILITCDGQGTGIMEMCKAYQVRIKLPRWYWFLLQSKISSVYSSEVQYDPTQVISVASQNLVCRIVMIN